MHPNASRYPLKSRMIVPKVGDEIIGFGPCRILTEGVPYVVGEVTGSLVRTTCGTSLAREGFDYAQSEEHPLVYRIVRRNRSSSKSKYSQTEPTDQRG